MNFSKEDLAVICRKFKRDSYSYEEFQRLTKQEAKRVSEAAVKISWLDGDERLHPATVAIRAFCTVLKHSNDVNELMATLEVVALMTQHYEHEDFQKQLKVIDRRLLTTGFKEAGEIAIERGITEDTTENPTNASNATLSEKSSELVSTMAQCVSKHSSNLKLFNNWSLGYINCVCTTIATEYSFSSEHQVDEFIISLYCQGVVVPKFSPVLFSKLRLFTMYFFNLSNPKPLRAEVNNPREKTPRYFFISPLFIKSVLL
jgi:hypothetical protein